MLKIRRSCYHLIFNMGIPIIGKMVFILRQTLVHSGMELLRGSYLATHAVINCGIFCRDSKYGLGFTALGILGFISLAAHNQIAKILDQEQTHGWSSRLASPYGYININMTWIALLIKAKQSMQKCINAWEINFLWCPWMSWIYCKIPEIIHWQQGKSEGFDGYDWPSNLTQNGFK